MNNVARFRLLTDTHEPPSDRDLIARTLEGDGAAYGIIVDRFQRKIFRVAFAIVRDEMEADVIAQDTFVQAYTHLAKFQGRSELETWLTRIAINRSRDALRRRKFVSLFTSRDDEDDERMYVFEPVDERPDAERQIMAGQLRVAIERAVDKLSTQQKVIFRLRHYENLALEEIAGLLGLRAGTVRAHLFRAVHKIRKELAHWNSRGPQGNDDDDYEAAL
ncbi:MAG TPA: sigma-70 family RNA polymerase sigma factor [Thermoanaerobaculia bacterium]|nr:sigma-70 family RNA polymerase sigma factor [Thermoanaerobaculia bacterium]